MNYFTLERYLRLQDFSSDAAMDAADAEWEEAAARYRRALKRLLPAMPKGLRSLAEGFYLHDAEILSMGEQGQTFVMVLRLDTPPHDLLVLTYRLTEPPFLNRDAFAARGESRVVEWMYDEIGPPRGPSGTWSHAILLSNGWEVALRFRDVKVQKVSSLLPAALSPAAATG